MMDGGEGVGLGWVVGGGLFGGDLVPVSNLGGIGAPNHDAGPAETWVCATVRVCVGVPLFSVHGGSYPACHDPCGGGDDDYDSVLFFFSGRGGGRRGEGYTTRLRVCTLYPFPWFGHVLHAHTSCILHNTFLADRA